MDSELRAGEADCDRVNSNSFLYHVKQSNNSKCTTSVVDTNEANYQARLGQSSPQGVLLLPSLGLKSESHHTSVGNWVGGKKQRCAAQRVRCAADERAAATRRVRARSHAALNYMHVHCNLVSGREREEPIVQILEYEHSDHSVFNACVCLSTLVLFATPWQERRMSWRLSLR